MTLREQIEAELDRREAVARAATAGPWRYKPNKVWRNENGGEREEFVGAGPTDATVCVAATGPEDHPQSMSDAQFIALHDPADALRRYAAARRVLQRHAITGTSPHHGPVVEVCSWCGWDPEHPRLCHELLDLADSLGLAAGISSEEGTQHG